MVAKLEPGTKVKLWAPLTWGGHPYPATGTINRFIEGYPDPKGRDTYQVDFAEGDLPFACLPREWLFPIEVEP